MNEDLNPESDNLSSEEKEFEQVLRPKLFSDFKGQEKIVDNLEVFIQAAKQREEALDHVLLHGPPGLGKTTLSYSTCIWTRFNHYIYLVILHSRV